MTIGTSVRNDLIRLGAHTPDQIGYFLQVGVTVSQGSGSGQTIAKGNSVRTVCTGGAQSFSVRANVVSGTGLTSGAATVKAGARTGLSGETMQDDGLTQTETVTLAIQGS